MKKITIAAFLALVAIAATGIAPSVSAVSKSASSTTVPGGTSAPSSRMCAQVITYAKSPSGECKSFPTPCDVPADWAKVSSCSSSASTGDINNRLQQMRVNLEDFKANKEQEAADRAAALKEKVASKKKAIEARAAEAKKAKDEKRKTVLLNLLDIQIKQFTNTKERVAKMPNITDTLKTDLNTAIDAAIANLNAEKAKVQAATTPEELKTLAKEIKDMFKTKRDIVKKIVNAILSSRVQKAVDLAGDRLTEMKTQIADLKAAGKDVSGLETLLANVEAKIAAAKSAVGKEDLKKATEELRNAYKELQKAIAKLNGMPAPSASPAPSVSPTSTPSVTSTPTPSVTPTPSPAI